MVLQHLKNLQQLEKKEEHRIMIKLRSIVNEEAFDYDSFAKERDSMLNNLATYLKAKHRGTYKIAGSNLDIRQASGDGNTMLSSIEEFCAKNNLPYKNFKLHGREGHQQYISARPAGLNITMSNFKTSTKESTTMKLTSLVKEETFKEGTEIYRVSLFEGSDQFKQYFHIGKLAEAQKEAKAELERQYRYRKTDEVLWADFQTPTNWRGEVKTRVKINDEDDLVTIYRRK